MSSVSIAMATYNGERFLQEQLNSLAAQTLLPAELVVTDDKSIDGTIAILKAFAARAPFPVRITQNPEQMGYRANFMKAAQLCTGDYIAFCDQDDVWFPGKLSACLALFDEKILLVYHNSTVTDEQLKPIGKLDAYKPILSSASALSFKPLHFSPGFTEIIHRSLLSFESAWNNSHDPYDRTQREAHDKWFFYLAAAIGNIAYIEQPLAYYRRHETVTTNWKQDGLLSKAKQISSDQVEGIRALQECFSSRAKALENTKANVEPFRILSGYYERRLQLYASESLLQRTGLLFKLVYLGVYRSKNKWGLGCGALIRDLVCGVLRLKFKVGQ